MRLNITHINKIERADIVLNGLTVIAGNNDSGKSTVGKLLFSVIKSFGNTDRLSIQSLGRAMRLKAAQLYSSINLAEKESGEKIKDDILPPTLNGFMKELETYPDDKTWTDRIKEVLEKTNIVPQQRARIVRYMNQLARLTTEKTNPEMMLEREFQAMLEAEFLNSICSYGTECSEIRFSEESEGEMYIRLTNNKIADFKCVKGSWTQDATLVESPLYIHLIDLLSSAQTLNERSFTIAGKDVLRPLINYHIKDMAQKLDAFRFSLPDNRQPLFASDILEHIGTITGGHFHSDSKSRNLYWEKDGKNYPPVNVASGIKTFGVLQMLLETQALDESKILIWDEPENHLHPEWQIRFASTLVELARTGVPVLISSHSPYFIQAVRHSAEKSSMKDYVNYYLAEETGNGLSVLENVTDDLNRIFLKLAQPMNEIVNLGL